MWIVIDRRHRAVRKSSGKSRIIDRAVLEHVRDARWRAKVVLEHVEVVFADAHQIDSRDMRVDVAGHVDTDHLGTIERVAQNVTSGDHAFANDALVVVNVVQEKIERAHPLLESERELAPFLGAQNARHDVERNEPLGSAGFAVDVERDSDSLKGEIGLAPFLGEDLGLGLGEPALHGIERLANLRLPIAIHLVERRRHFSRQCASAKTRPRGD